MVPEIGVLGVPYIATNYQDARKIVLSALFDDISVKLVLPEII